MFKISAQENIPPPHRFGIDLLDLVALSQNKPGFASHHLKEPLQKSLTATLGENHDNNLGVFFVATLRNSLARIFHEGPPVKAYLAKLNWEIARKSLVVPSFEGNLTICDAKLGLMVEVQTVRCR